jgi:hypothetical protein
LFGFSLCYKYLIPNGVSPRGTKYFAKGIPSEIENK